MGKCLKILFIILLALILEVNTFALDQNTYQEFIKEAPDDFSLENITDVESSISLSGFGAKVLSSVKVAFKENIYLFFTILGIVILFSLISNIQSGNSQIIHTMSVVISITVITLTFPSVNNCITKIRDCIESTNVFCSSAIPIILGLCISSGNSFSGSVFSTSVSFIAALLETVSESILMPLVIVYMTFALLSNFSASINISSLDKQIKKFIKWVIGAFITLFSFSMSLQTFLSSSSDSILKHSIKSAVGSFVPVVGNLLSSSIDSVFSIASGSKTTLAIVGIIVIVSIFLPAISSSVIFGISLSTANLISTFLKQDSISKTLSSIADTFYLLAGICASCVFMMIISFLLICLNLG